MGGEYSMHIRSEKCLQILVCGSAGKKQLGTRTLRWENNIKIYIKIILSS
jgi:hypothetical protein